MSTGKTVVKTLKVKPFPFGLSLKSATGSIQGKVIKLTTVGFLAEVAMPHIKIGEKFELSFELPVLHYAVSELGVIVKIYNQFGGAMKGEKNAVITVEVHFRSLNSANKEKILEFLNLVQGTGRSS